MNPRDFDPGAIPAGTKRRLWLEFPAGALELRLPLLVARGAEPGPVLSMTACIHGDEYEGVGAIFDFFETLDPEAITGSVIAAPVANPPAFHAISRTSPLDQANLARVFPGRDDGTPSEALAAVLDGCVIAHASFFLDLHSGGVRYWMPTMAGYYTEDPRSLAAARAFGAPVIWGHPVIPPGRTLSCAQARGIPFLYTEARGAGRIDPADAAVFARGIRNVARYAGVLRDALEPGPKPVHLMGDGNTDRGIEASRDGFLVPEVQPLEAVRKGRRVGRLLDLDGSVIEEYLAPVDGVAAMIRLAPSVRAGEPLFLFAERLAEAA